MSPNKYPSTWTAATMRIYEVEKILMAYNEIIDHNPDLDHPDVRSKLLGIRKEADQVFERWGPRLHPTSEKDK